MVIPDTRGTTTTISNVKVLENVHNFFGFGPGFRRFSPLYVGEFAPGNCFSFLYSVQIRDKKKNYGGTEGFSVVRLWELKCGV
jgi:hypothetical protein